MNRIALALIVCVTATLHDVIGKPCVFVTSEGRADCGRSRRTRFPSPWPFDVHFLDFSSNFLTSLEGLADPRLTTLRHLDVSDNNLTTLPDGVFKSVPHLQELKLDKNALRYLTDRVFQNILELSALNLRNTQLSSMSEELLSPLIVLKSLDVGFNNLTAVPIEALSRLSNLTSLVLRGNRLQSLRNNSFAMLPLLEYLDLGQNRLSALDLNAFRGLSRLRTLYMDNNHIMLDHSSYPPGVFSHLTALQSLFILGNDGRAEGDYPLNVFSQLSTLEVLQIDPFREPRFGAAFTNLTHLTYLALTTTMGFDCAMKIISNDTFEAFRESSLQTLVINCPLVSVETCAFCRLPHLLSLTITGRPIYITLARLLLSLYGLRNQTLELLDLPKINPRSDGPPALLDRSNMQHLNDICVKRLRLSSCRISAATSNAIDVNGRFVERCCKGEDGQEGGEVTVQGQEPLIHQS